MVTRYYKFEAWDPLNGKLFLHKMLSSMETEAFDPVMAGFMYDQAWRELTERMKGNLTRFRFLGSYKTDFITGREVFDPESEGLFDG